MKYITKLKIAWANTHIANKLTFLLTLVIAAANIAYVCYARKQFIAMSGQLGQMQSSSRQTDKLLCLYQQQLVELRKQATDTHTLAEAAGRQADNMKTLAASTQKVLDANIEASQLDQRPWIYAARFELSNEPDVDKPFWITAYTVNAGKTPAVESYAANLVLWQHKEPPFTNFDNAKADIKNLIPPSSPINNATLSVESEHGTIPTAQVGGYLEGKTRLYFHMKFYYRDVFGNWHWTTMCAVHSHGAPLGSFDFCDRGNDVGEGRPKQH